MVVLGWVIVLVVVIALVAIVIPEVVDEMDSMILVVGMGLIVLALIMLVEEL